MDPQINFTAVALLAAIGAAAYFLIPKGIELNNNTEDRKRRAMKLSAWCRSNGLSVLSKALEDYATDSWMELAGTVRELCDLIGDQEALQDTLDKFLRKQLERQVSTADGRENLLKAIEDLLKLKINRDALVQKPVELSVAKESLSD